MQRMILGVAAAGFFAYNAATQLQFPSTESSDSSSASSSATARASTADDGADQTPHPTEPAYKAVIGCLSDMDDLLDTVHDAASFAAAKPKLLSRARRHVAQAAKASTKGMTQLNRAEAKEMQQAANRHMESLARAMQKVPAVGEFFEKDIAAVMQAR